MKLYHGSNIEVAVHGASHSNISLVHRWHYLN